VVLPPRSTNSGPILTLTTLKDIFSTGSRMEGRTFLQEKLEYRMSDRDHIIDVEFEELLGKLSKENQKR
jgi:hypothetical protein